MKLSDLRQEHALPLEISYNSKWLESLLRESRSDKVIPGRTPKSECKPYTPALPLVHDGGLRTLVAVSPDHREAVQKLVHRRYAWRGYNVPQMDHAVDVAAAGQESSVTLLAEQQGTLVGTLTLTLDSPRGLLAEQTYGEEIERVRSQGRQIGELVKLAMEEGVDWKSVLDSLLQATYLLAHVLHCSTDLFIEVNPRHVRFYQRVFGFTSGTAQRLCARAGAPSVLMRLDLEEFSQRLTSQRLKLHAS
jgi:hypothetical protein